MARNRQRAKQRQARRKTQGGQPGSEVSVETAAVATDAPATDAPAKPQKPAPAKAVEKSAKPAAAPAKDAPRQRGRLIGFLRSSWAELQRVQWPDRTQVSSLTGVVIGFVIIAGAYLGLIDVVASKIVNFLVF